MSHVDCPEVSVIVPVWNGSALLREALDSASSELAGIGEIVVVDDGSTDSSAEVASRFGSTVRCFTRPHRGLNATLNYGVRVARGGILAFIDSDDLWTKGRLAKMLELQQSSGRDLVIGLTQTLDLQTQRLDGACSGPVRRVEPYLAMSLGAALIRRHLFDRLGFFDETLAHCGDWDWFLRLREERIPISILRETVLLYRRHGGNMTLDVRQGYADQLRAVKKSLDRRRDRSDRGDLDSLYDLGS